MNSTYKKEKKVYILFLVIFTLIHISGDHVFNKTNNLKLAILFLGIVTVFSYSLIVKKKFNNQYILLLSIPFISTLPGLIFSQGSYDYNFPHEASSLILCSLWAYLIIQYKNNFNNQNYLLYLFIPITIFVITIGLLEKLGLSPLLRFHINPFESIWTDHPTLFTGIPDRIESTFGNINYFAGYLIQLIPIFMAYFLTTDNKICQKTPYLTIITLLYVSLFFTGTRAALFATFLSSCLFMSGWMIIKNKVSSKHLRNSGIVIFIIIAITFYLHQNRILDLLSYNAWHSRVIPWQAAIDSIKNAPIFGYGLGASYELFFEFNDPQGRLALPNYSYNHVHFELLEIAQEGGILGVLGYLLFWGYILVSLTKLCINKKVDDSARILALSLICSFIAFHIHGCFSVAPRMIAVKLVTYTLIAYSLILISKYRIHPHKDKTSKLPILLILVALLSILAWLVPFLSSQYHYAKTLPSQLIKPLKSISHSSNDIYTINRAAWRAKDIKDQDWLEEMLIRSHDVFPNYRKLAYLNAHNALLVDNHNKARELALAAQKRDLYLNELNELLGYIALKTGDRDLFIDQLSIALKLNYCRELKIHCDKQPIKVLWGETLSAINTVENKNGVTFIIASDLFTKIQLNNINEISQVIRNSPYFQPQSMNGEMMNRHDWQQLTQYVELSDSINKHTTYRAKELAKNSGVTLYKQIRQYHEITADHDQFITESLISKREIEAQLDHKINLDKFLKSRVIYFHILHWLKTVKTYNN